jgi:hypothetical protein
MNDKYELLDVDEATGLHRIRALRDIPRYGVRAGDIGGLVAGPDNLSQDGDGWVSGDGRVSGNGRVSGDGRVYGRRDILTISPVASEDCHLTLFRTPTGHLCQVGCWAGDLDALTDLIEGDRWPSGCGAATREAHRPEMRAVIALCRVRAATWTPREDAATETPESTPVEP